MTYKKLPLLLAMAICLFVLMSGSSFNSARAQDEAATPAPSPTPESEELRRLRERNEVLEQETKAAQFERDKAKAEREELEAKFPKPTSSPLEGKTEVDTGVKIETEMVAYLSMAQAANRIVADMKNHATGVTGIAIYNDRDVKSLLGYVAITNQLQVIKDEYNRLIVASPTPTPTTPDRVSFTGAGAAATPTIATSILGSFVDLIALFRTDTTVNGMSFNIEEAALVSEVFRALKRPATATPCPSPSPSPSPGQTPTTPSCGGYGPDINLFYPAIVPPNINANKRFLILGKIQEVYLLKAKAEELITKIEENEKALQETKEKIKALEARKNGIDGEIEKLRRELKSWQHLYWKWPSPVRAERIEELTRQIEELKDEKQEIGAPGTGKIDQAKALAAELEDALKVHYDQIMPVETTASEPDEEALRNLKKDSLLKLKALNAQFDKLRDELIKVDNGAGINALTSYLQAENLRDALGCHEETVVTDKPGEPKGQKNVETRLTCPNAYLLQLKVVSAGGNNRIRRNLIRDVFRGADISHSGGAIVEYILYDMTNGASKASNTFTVYQGYIKANNIPKLADENP